MSAVDWPLPAVLAHRCGGALAPENTLAGLGVAAALGCRGVEFDVMLSADGVPVVIHDETVDRTTDGRGCVSALSLAELRRLDAGAWRGPAFAGERLPTLVETLERCASLGLAVNLEIKPATGHDVDTGRVVVETLLQGFADALTGLVLSSFSESSLAAARAVCPDFQYGLLFGELPEDWRTRAGALQVDAIHADTRYLSAATVAQLRDAGYRVAAYTENDPVLATRLRRWGVDSVITDRPDVVLDSVIMTA